MLQAPPATACSVGVFAFDSPPPLFLPLGAQLLTALVLAGLSRHGAATARAELRWANSSGCDRRPCTGIVDMQQINAVVEQDQLQQSCY